MALVDCLSERGLSKNAAWARILGRKFMTMRSNSCSSPPHISKSWRSQHLINVFAQRLTLFLEIKNDKIPYQSFSDEDGKNPSAARFCTVPNSSHSLNNPRKIGAQHRKPWAVHGVRTSYHQPSPTH